MEKTCKITIIPTERYSRIGKFMDTNNLVFNNNKDIARGEFHNLYILSDEEIKEGDLYFPPSYTIQKAGDKEHCEVLNSLNPLKVISSTDKSLNLPVIPQNYIKYFVEQYNKGNIIEEVELETTYNITPELQGQMNPPIKAELKLQNNEVCPTILEISYCINCGEAKELHQYESKFEKVCFDCARKLGLIAPEIKVVKQSIEEAEIIADICWKQEMNPEIGECLFHRTTDEDIFKSGVISGVSYLKSKMYSEDDLYELTNWLKTTSFNVEGYSADDCLKEWFNQNKK
jgi:hypothetical protein